MNIVAAQPIRPYTSPMSVVWTRGEPCTEVQCHLLTTALADGTAKVIESGRWGQYNAILRWSPNENMSLYFLGELSTDHPPVPG
jgi:hypothetical protein